RADLPLLRTLPEIAERNVAPDVAIEIDQYRVRVREHVAIFRDAVVRFDLCRIGTELETEGDHDTRAEALPVDVRIRNQVRVVIADRTVHLALDRELGKCGDLAVEARDDVGELLSERGGGRRLPVRGGRHGEGGRA